MRGPSSQINRSKIAFMALSGISLKIRFAALGPSSSLWFASLSVGWLVAVALLLSELLLFLLFVLSFALSLVTEAVVVVGEGPRAPGCLIRSAKII